MASLFSVREELLTGAWPPLTAIRPRRRLSHSTAFSKPMIITQGRPTSPVKRRQDPRIPIRHRNERSVPILRSSTGFTQISMITMTITQCLLCHQLIQLSPCLHGFFIRLHSFFLRLVPFLLHNFDHLLLLLNFPLLQSSAPDAATSA